MEQLVALQSAAAAGDVPAMVAAQADAEHHQPPDEGIAAQQAGGGLLGNGLLASQALQLGGQIISGFAQGSAADRAAQEEAEQERIEYDRSAYNYGYRNVYPTDNKGRTVGGIPLRQERIYDYAAPNMQNPAPGGLMSAFSRPQPYYQIINGQVVLTGGA